MIVVTKIEELQKILKKKDINLRTSLVPTMGNLHSGHLKLISEAFKVSDFVSASIFVNPLQFNPDEDFANYPRSLEADLSKLENNGCSLAFIPESEELIEGIVKESADGYLSNILCGNMRENHFDGVVTIVNKLFELFNPNFALFGEKDYQQLMIVKHFVERKKLNLKIYGVPTEREINGLAKSSRNTFLTQVEKERASLIYKMLQNSKELIIKSKDLEDVMRDGLKFLKDNGFKVDYFEARCSKTLKPIINSDDVILLCAAHISSVRLIDNLRV